MTDPRELQLNKQLPLRWRGNGPVILDFETAVGGCSGGGEDGCGLCPGLGHCIGISPFAVDGIAGKKVFNGFGIE